MTVRGLQTMGCQPPGSDLRIAVLRRRTHDVAQPASGTVAACAASQRLLPFADCWGAMKTNDIGSAAVDLCVGCPAFGDGVDYRTADRIIRRSIDLGITSFDTANVYGGGASESFLGRTLSRVRERVTITTKVGHASDGVTGTSPAAIRTALSASLRRLGTDYIDVYLLHRPDPRTPVAATVGTLRDLFDEGKVLAIGASGYALEDLQQLMSEAALAGVPFRTYQANYSLLVRQAEVDLVPLCRRMQVGLVPFFALAGELLTGKYRGNMNPITGRYAHAPREWKQAALTVENYEKIARLESVACKAGLTLVELSLSWLARRPAVSSVLVGVTSVAQLEENARAIRPLERGVFAAVEEVCGQD